MGDLHCSSDTGSLSPLAFLPSRLFFLSFCPWKRHLSTLRYRVPKVKCQPNNIQANGKLDEDERSEGECAPELAVASTVDNSEPSVPARNASSSLAGPGLLNWGICQGLLCLVQGSKLPRTEVVSIQPEMKRSAEISTSQTMSAHTGLVAFSHVCSVQQPAELHNAPLPLKVLAASACSTAAQDRSLGAVASFFSP